MTLTTGKTNNIDTVYTYPFGMFRCDTSDRGPFIHTRRPKKTQEDLQKLSIM